MADLALTRSEDEDEDEDDLSESQAKPANVKHSRQPAKIACGHRTPQAARRIAFPNSVSQGREHSVKRPQKGVHYLVVVSQ